MTKSEAEVAYKKAVQDWKNAKLEVETSEGADVQQTAAINKAWQKVLDAKKVLNAMKE